MNLNSVDDKEDLFSFLSDFSIGPMLSIFIVTNCHHMYVIIQDYVTLWFAFWGDYSMIFWHILRKNKKYISIFLSFLCAEMVPVVEILAHGK